MAVRKDTRKGWIVDFVFTHADGRTSRVRKRSPVQTRRGTEQYERQMRESMLFPRRKEVPTLNEFSREFIEVYAKVNNKPSEVAKKRSVFRMHLLPMFGRTRLDQIGARDIERFKARKDEEGLSPKSINNYLSMLHRCLAVAAEWGLLEHVPHVKWKKVPKPPFDFLDFSEAERLVTAAEPEWRSMIVMGLRTGLRQGELLALRWDDVDLVAGRVMVRQAVWKGFEGTPKSGKPREVPLSPQAVDVMRRHRHLRGEYVFCRVDGKRLTDTECKWPLYRTCRRAGLRRIGWHVLRHTFASHLVMRGVALKAVQELLGHGTIEMTMRYAHLSPDVRRDAVALLDRGTLVAPGELCDAKAAESL